MSFPFLSAHVPDSPRVSRYQVFGERCSGTNFLIRLLETNVTSAIFTEVFGFKHWFVPEALCLPADTLGLVIVRNPEDWLQSLHEKAWHMPEEVAALPFADFIRTEWRCVWDDHFLGVPDGHPQWGSEMVHERQAFAAAPIADAVTLRRLKAENWERLAQRSPAFAFLRYEDLRADPQGFLDALGRWGMFYDEYRPVGSYKGEGNKIFAPKARAPLSDQDKAYVDERLDLEREALWGYR
ncbi:hypothetical protein [Parvularcula dongshanensis]|uniref:Sulfotransferase domain-containing protein n=1 Tax=Parvularcula dongshanensis TaxID=1173995 RepID=A0A840I0S7_9PROT|nr:hypothetical protein [Parvularcula dongshanensis]MBB4657844.1 hypothetical protein [Parvularcula dongshanensis]